MSAGLRSKTPSEYVRSKPDRRRHFRVEKALKGRFMHEETEYSLETLNISCGSALIKAEFLPPIGQIVVCYFDDIGRVQVNVTRHQDDCFAVVFNVSEHKRDKLADRLIWLINHEALGLEDNRDHSRKTATGPALVTRSDGTKLQCRVSDISLTGAAFTHSGPPLIVGEYVKAGALSGEVIRSIGGEFAIRFTQGQKT